MRPTPRPRRRSAQDIGYSRVAIEVSSLDEALHACGALPLGEAQTVDGLRRVCIYDPDSVLVELIEQPQRGARADIVGVAASVPELSRSLKFFEHTLGLERLPPAAERESLWGLAGADRELVRLDAGPLWLELVEYRSPQPAAWPDGYRLSDQGLLNIAFGFRRGPDFHAASKRIFSAGYRSNCKPAGGGPVHCVYTNDDQGFSVELLHVHPALDKMTGFAPPPRWLAPVQKAAFLPDVGVKSVRPPEPFDEPGRSERVDVGEVELQVHVCGDGPPVLLLHGFPDQWTSWRGTMKRLAEAGYMAVAPELRGYGASDRPEEVKAYSCDRLAGDVAGLIGWLDRGPVTLVGHDFGGLIGWHAAGAHPKLVERFVAINAPHPGLTRQNSTATAQQLLRSSYAALFLLPKIPERIIARQSFLRRALQCSAAPGAFSKDELQQHAAAMASPAAARAAVNYYRALNTIPTRSQPLQCPALLLYGTEDAFLTRVMFEGLSRYAPQLERIDLAGVGHWVAQEAPELLAPHILAFIERTETAPASDTRPLAG